MLSNRENLRRLNYNNQYRTDVENILLKEMVENDMDDILKEHSEIDYMDLDNSNIFDDDEYEDDYDDEYELDDNEDYDDDEDEDDDDDDYLDEQSMIKLF